MSDGFGLSGVFSYGPGVDEPADLKPITAISEQSQHQGSKGNDRGDSGHENGSFQTCQWSKRSVGFSYIAAEVCKSEVNLGHQPLELSVSSRFGSYRLGLNLFYCSKPQGLLAKILSFTHCSRRPSRRSGAYALFVRPCPIVPANVRPMRAAAGEDTPFLNHDEAMCLLGPIIMLPAAAR
jgi:hypothetical protein